MRQHAENPTTESDASVAPHSRSPRVMIAAALAVFLLTVALLYWSWLPTKNPSTMIVVQGTPDYVGSEVTVEPIDGFAQPLSATLAPEDNFRVRLHVAPGVYHVTIKHHGRILAESDKVRPGISEPYFIYLHPPASRPAAG